jgi:hypothetical protein
MAIDKATLDTYLLSAVTAVGEGAYATAKTALAQAGIVLAGLPDYAIGNRRIEYRQQIEAMMNQLDTLAASSTTSKKNMRVFGKYSRE